MLDNNIYLVWLHYLWFSHKKIHSIFAKKNNYKEFFDNINYSLLISNWFSKNKINDILEKKAGLNLLKIKEILENENVEIITINDFSYPENLKNISNPPYLLYVKGKLDNKPKLSIVWSRKITSYWIKVIERLLPDLTKYFTIVSWGAIWTDTEIHEATLENKWKTIVVVWTWIDIDYPSSNIKLYKDIVKSGWCIISIFPLGEYWQPHNFPIRNEIVSWISSWVLIIEAAEKSWTLITANLALDQWKDLFVIPWDVFRWNSIWCNNLIKKWNAKLVASSQDILEEYNFSKESLSKNNLKPKFIDKTEENIYNLLFTEPLNVNEISKLLSLDLKIVSFKLSMLEVSWFIKKTIAWKYELI